MSKVLHAGAIPGTPGSNVVSIYEGGDDNPLTNPTGNLNRLYFDSRLDYLNIVGQIDTSVSFPFEAITTSCGKKGKDCSAIVRSGQRIYNLGAHGQAYTPAILLYDLGSRRAITGNMFIQTVSNTSFRLCWVVIDATYIYLKERWFVRYNDLAAIDKNYRIHIFNKPSV
jgi:hypothetical protein